MVKINKKKMAFKIEILFDELLLLLDGYSIKGSVLRAYWIWPF